eukprot:CAMPEP_0181315210 /NCGR_PEP_ID=MMETSP1101-20121128/15247_1 /TAXON_ID=46948 /ORGANISM="Rhodomonas abbreviata, Strain Caron Lab Isolate" /LENGTH=285 /DNA_ID=CAMNT_0023422389 /DNA_START=96 /DNA_END=950 /DNA_ORIENTATION=-
MAELGDKRGPEDAPEEDVDTKRQMTAPSDPPQEVEEKGAEAFTDGAEPQPDAGAQAAEQPSEGQGAPMTPEPEDNPLPLPPGWEEHVSKRTGRAFWFHAATKERSWYHPGLKEAAPPESPPGEPPSSAFERPAPSQGKTDSAAPAGGEASASSNGDKGGGGGERGERKHFPSGPVVVHPLTRLPLRNGEQLCNHYASHGCCKFGEGCKFDHPPFYASAELLQPHVLRSSMGGQVPDGYAMSGGLPVRPGVDDCSFFLRTCMCKFGTTCKWNHPKERQTRLPTIAP